MKRTFLIAIAVCSCIFCSISPAQSSPIFGPKKYTREKVKPEKTKEIFQVCALSGIYKLTVENGLYTIIDDEENGDEKKDKEDKEQKKTRVSAGEIEINGEEVIEEDDFNKQVTRVEKTVLLLQGENLIEVEIEGEPGAFITLTIECQSGCLEPKITSPVTGSAINKSKTIIQGNLFNAIGETGVVLQSSGASGQISAIAQTQGNSFAGVIPLQTGANTITAQATDACGYKVTDTITVNTETLKEKIRLSANPTSGIPTLNVALEAEATLPNPISNYSWDFNGDGTIDQSGAALSSLTTQYLNPGLYFPKVTITDNQGNTFEETTVVNVLSKEQMDALLKGKLEGMKGFLVNGKIDSALKYFIGGQSSKYKAALVALKDQLPTIFLAEEDLRYVSSYENWIEYDNIVLEGDIAYSYPIIFIKDENGLWKIKQF